MKKGKYRNNDQSLVLPPGISSPVERITGVWEFSRPPKGPSSCRSLPSHLIHLITKGSYRLRTDGREYDIRCGDVIYYYESEEVEWLGNEVPVSFYSVGFDAPSLAPPPLEARVFPGSREIRKAFDALFAASLQAEPMSRRLAMHAALLQVLLEVHQHNRAHSESTVAAAMGQDENPQTPPWWRIEQDVRQNKRFRPTLEELAEWAGCSRASVCRACKAATSQSPIRRLRALRMAEAQGLLRLSAMTVSQVAEYLGYNRVHEFSREYRRHFGHPPTATRA